MSGKSPVNIWSLTLEFLRLLTGKAYPDPKPGSHVTITVSLPSSLTPDRLTLQKILDVTRKITELLIGEMESPLGLCLDVKAENEAEPVTGESRCSRADLKMDPPEVTTVKSPLGDHGEMGTSSEEDPGEDLISDVEPEEEKVVLVKIKEEEMLLELSPDPGDTMEENVKTETEKVFVRNKEESPLLISPDGRYNRNKTKDHDAILLHGCGQDDITAESTGSPTTTKLHISLPPADLSSHNSIPSVYLPRYTAQTSKKPHSCSECGKSFSHKSLLIRHVRVHVGEKPYSCSECGKCFFDKSALIKHERVHKGERPYSCPRCEKSFFQKAQLISHERVHTGEKPYSCLDCGKCFSQKSNLITHERVHTGEKPFSCTQCGKSFSQKSVLISHERVHAGEKPFSCSECGKCFSQKSHLTGHKRLHAGEKPYSCTECGKCFSHQSALKSHKRVHTREKPYSCSECGTCFSNKSALRKHVKLHRE